MNNPVTGHREIEIDGKRYTLRYTWRALAAIEHKHGDNPNLFNPEVLADIASAGIYPALTAEQILDLSPPRITVAMAVQEAIRWANFGPEGPPEVKLPATEKKSLHPAVGFWHRFRKLFRGA